MGAKLARDEDDAVFQGIEAPASRASFAPTAVRRFAKFLRPSDSLNL
ncbi:hypothetical protein AK973_3367 [Pseudomonas brassicacearum]|nr:hypothetical protein AK973_3367 [Pseudomonas brassicacearum]